ncbi:vascular cell adhesion protein 1-like isoform X1 [Genypterus blacodes]|uniref:vascular cell adhesion protein 1-like isoform X1 n=2 Tax=Genypterus blacodes TaxID=154954 RepID=UPI003F77143A
MLLRPVFALWALVTFQRRFHVSSCVPTCEDKPEFFPPRLVVKFNDSASALCVGCERLCLNRTVDLESALGTETPNGTRITWDVDRMTEWDTSPMCFYSFNDDDDQCCARLAVTVYQPPDIVSISLVDHSGPMLEGHQYTLQCMVQGVAPAEHLLVTFLKGKEPLGPSQSTMTRQKTPVTEFFSLNITATKEDDRVQYRCQAALELGPDGPRDKPVVESTSLKSTVHYGPQTDQTSQSITLIAGEPLSLNCSAIANPAPSYTWTLPPARPHSFNSSVLNISSVALVDGGQYVCVISNERGNVTVTYNVTVNVDYVPIIIGVVVVLLLLVIFVVAIVSYQHHKRNRTGQYTPGAGTGCKMLQWPLNGNK